MESLSDLRFLLEDREIFEARQEFQKIFQKLQQQKFAANNLSVPQLAASSGTAVRSNTPSNTPSSSPHEHCPRPAIHEYPFA
jgi:hypothetical protein